MGINVDLPEKMIPALFGKHRYKVFRGGRGSGKSWSVARALVALGRSKKLRILCAREVQRSIQDSSYKLLKDQIEMLGLGGDYEVLKNEIRGKNGTEFIFRGLGNLTAESIKSFEGIDIAWVEEAHTVSDRSWELLIPTVRKGGSEIWVTYNPESPEDPVDRRFVVQPPPDSAIVNINWYDNPWFPEVLRGEKDYLYQVDTATAEHIWGGAYRKASDAQILRGRYSIHEFVPEPFWDGPYHGIDFGFAQDQGTMIRCWIHEGDLWLEYEAAGLGVDNDDLPDLWDTIPNARNYVARADCARPETISHVRRLGYNRVVACKKWKGCEQDGIDHLRSYKQIHIHPRCKLACEEAKNWCWKKDRQTGDILNVTTGKFDNTWAAIRYALEPIIMHGSRQHLPEEEVDDVYGLGDASIYNALAGGKSDGWMR
jgi:phage terminase large subunit